jgi:hypothetical protein
MSLYKHKLYLLVNKPGRFEVPGLIATNLCERSVRIIPLHLPSGLHPRINIPTIEITLSDMAVDQLPDDLE